MHLGWISKQLETTAHCWASPTPTVPFKLTEFAGSGRLDYYFQKKECKIPSSLFMNLHTPVNAAAPLLAFYLMQRWLRI